MNITLTPNNFHLSEFEKAKNSLTRIKRSIEYLIEDSTFDKIDRIGLTIAKEQLEIVLECMDKKHNLQEVV